MKPPGFWRPQTQTTLTLVKCLHGYFFSFLKLQLSVSDSRGHRYFSCLVVCQQVFSTAIWLHYEEHCGLSSGVEVVRALSFGDGCLLPLLHWRMALLIRRFMWAVLKLKRIKETKISKKINLIQSRFSWTEADVFRKENSDGDAFFF